MSILAAGCGKIVFGLIERIDPIERFTFLDAVADLLEQPDAGALVDRRAGGACQPVQPQAIDAGNNAVALRPSRRNDQFPSSPRMPDGPCASMIFCICCERGPALEQLAGAAIAGAAPQLRIVFQQMGGKPQRFFPQVRAARPDGWPEPP